MIKRQAGMQAGKRRKLGTVRYYSFIIFFVIIFLSVFTLTI